VNLVHLTVQAVGAAPPGVFVRQGSRSGEALRRLSNVNEEPLVRCRLNWRLLVAFSQWIGRDTLHRYCDRMR
jgi:hypothetical protein